MKLVIHRPEEKIRVVVISFSLFMALMLFQTPYMRLGTLTASATLLLTIGAYFIQGKGLQGRLILNRNNTCLLLFLLYTVFLTLIKGRQPSGFVRYIAQIIMCLLLFSVELNQREHNYLKKVFVSAATVYSVLIIQSYYSNTREGYYHQDVLLFNTAFDPNYIGIPLVAATVLLMDNILKKRQWKQSVLMYAVNTAAIMYTASRGSFVALVCANLLIFSFFLLKQNMRLGQKIMLLFIPVLLLFVLIPVFRTLFPTEWTRITTYGENADNGRFMLWSAALKGWWESPVFGNGLGYVYAIHGWASHNTYLQVLSETGLIGFLLANAFVFPMLKKAIKRDVVLFCMLIGVLVQITFLDAVDNRCLWILMSWVAMLPQERKGALVYEKTFETMYTKI